MTRVDLLFRTVMVVLLAIAAAAQAQTSTTNAPPLKPGLWQIINDRQIDGQKAPDLSDHLKKMSPDMRKRMEANMKLHGVDMSGAAGTMKICQTRESLEQGRWQGDSGRCKSEVTSRTASSWKWRSACPQPPSETEGEATFASTEAYTLKSTTKMTLQGQTRVTTMNISGKWLGADCGDLKPVAAPKASAPAASKR